MPNLTHFISGNRYSDCILLLFLIVLCLLPACRDHSTGPEPVPSIQLDVDYRGTDFVWLKLSVEETVKDLHYLIRRNNEDRFTGQFSGRDTLITDTSLTPGTEYYYTVYGIKNSEPVDSGDTVPVTTLPLSSHDFHWEIDTLGEYGSGLRDVFAFSENDVWVVGEIITNVHTGDKSNAAHWDGTKWELHKIPAVAFHGMIYEKHIIQAIYGFNDHELWMFSLIGSSIYINENEWRSEFVEDLKGIIYDIWGTSSTNLYFVGGNGTIVHYDGSQYRRMESGTDADLKDIDGVYDPETGQTRIWVAGTGVLLYSEGETWEVVWDYDHPFFKDNYNNPNTVWVPDKKGFIVSVWGGSNSGTYLFNQQNPHQHTLLFNHDLFSFDMHGNSINDFFIVGDWNKVYHYNGSTVRNYPELSLDGYSFGIYHFNNHVFVAGATGSSFRAVVFRGVR